jgi:ArsR family transcriptional regulator, arsenate/arsenite/antimonite-responsive transcriptional repressor
MAYSKKEEFSNDEVRLAQFAKALSHPARIAIIKMLAQKSSCICNEMVEKLPLSQSTVSQHLKELKSAGIIKGTIDGPRVCYCLDEKTCREAKLFFDNIFQVIKCCNC